MRLFILALLGATALTIVGCDSNDDGSGDAARGPDGSRLPGSYAGRFPCANCAGIDVALRLTDDGYFFLRQTFVDEGDEAAEPVHAFGHWTWNPAESRVTLAGRGPDRTLFFDGTARLELATPSALPHVLEREPGSSGFGDVVRLEGAYMGAGANASFTECAMGLRLGLEDDAGGRSLARRYGDVARPDMPALTVLDARFVWSEDRNAPRAIVVENVVSLRPRADCVRSY